MEGTIRLLKEGGDHWGRMECKTVWRKFLISTTYQEWRGELGGKTGREQLSIELRNIKLKSWGDCLRKKDHKRRGGRFRGKAQSYNTASSFPKRRSER